MTLHQELLFKALPVQINHTTAKVCSDEGTLVAGAFQAGSLVLHTSDFRRRGPFITSGHVNEKCV